MKGKGSFKNVDGTKMKDGTEAWLQPSGNYYCRRSPSYDDWDSIVYYNLDKELVPLASATCPACKEKIESKMCADFKTCKCGKSFVDTDRWCPERHRYGGLIVEDVLNEAKKIIEK